jgi:hypothetical protein
VLVVEVVAFVESNVGALDTREHLKELSSVKCRSLLTRIHHVPHRSDLQFYIIDHLKLRSRDSLGRRESHGHLVDSTLAADAHHLLSAGSHHLLTLGTHLVLTLLALTLDSHLRR